jgi:hypothetical protein
LQSTILIKDLYEAFVGPKIIEYREDWDNLSDDVCYIDPDEEAQDSADKGLRERQKKEEDKNGVEKKAHKSPDHCARVCEYEGTDASYDDLTTEEDEGDEDHAEDDDAEGDDAIDESPLEDGIPATARLNKNSKSRRHLKKTLNRQCFQYRYYNGVCCTSRSFKLGVPKAIGAQDGEKWHSGWYLKGIKEWIEAKGECAEAEWKIPT